MALVKTTSNPYAQALAGMHYDISDLESEGRAVENEGIPFGRGVTYGTSQNQVNIFEAASKFLGVSVMRQDQEQPTSTLPGSIGLIEDESFVPQKAILEIATQGRIWARLAAGQNVAEGSPVHCQPATGLFGGASLANGEVVPTASFGVTDKTGEFVVINLNR